MILLQLFLAGITTMFFIITSWYFYRKSSVTKEGNRDLYVWMSINMGIWGVQYMVDAMLVYLKIGTFMPADLVVGPKLEPGFDPTFYYNISSLFDMLAMPCGAILIYKMLMAPMSRLKGCMFFIPYVASLLIYIFTEWSYISIFMYACTAILAIYVLSKAGLKVIKMERMIEDQYSDTTDRNFKWLKQFIIAFVIQFVLWSTLILTMGKEHLAACIYYVVSIVNWAVLTYYINKQKYSSNNDMDDTNVEAATTDKAADEENTAEEGTQKPNISARTQATMDVLGAEIERVCKKDKIFLNPSLNAADLAKAVHTNRTYVSKWFHDHGTNFYQYINEMRLEYAREQILNSSEQVTVIGLNSGFNHPNTFRNSFKEKYGCTPTEYRTLHAAKR